MSKQTWRSAFLLI